jgi:exopolyphosphatase/guanosine-5'-triphosphate,3'-diphosphate pyrophosphatase
MKPEHRAVIDVGTNSIKMLVADTVGGRVQPVLETSAKQAVRLGQGFYATRYLQPLAINAAAQAVADLVARARAFEPVSIRVIATSAVREALNREELVRAVRNACGAELEVITGDREAEWVFRGVTSDPTLAVCPLVILDVGGGSTEVIVTDGRTVCFRRSFDIGAVRLMEILQPRDPPHSGDWRRCEDFLGEFFSGLIAPLMTTSLRDRTDRMRLIGTGGTAACLASMQAKGKQKDWLTAQATRITHADLHAQAERLWSLTLAERKNVPGLPAKRADVIQTGVAIFDAAMPYLHFAEMSVSRRGVRFGVLVNAASAPVVVPKEATPIAAISLPDYQAEPIVAG